MILALWVGAGAAHGASEPPAPKIVGVDVGIAGYYKAGLWTPLRVRLAGLEPGWPSVLTVIAPDGDGVPHGISYPLEGDLLTRHDGESVAAVSVRPGRVEGQLTVEVHRGSLRIAGRVFRAGEIEGFRPALASDRRLLVVVGTDPGGVEEAVRLQRRKADRAAVVASVDHFHALPTRWHGYEAVDTVVVGTSRPDAFAGVRAADPQVDALKRWVRLGGNLVICMGAGAEGIWDRWPLARLVPGEGVEAVGLRQVSGLETYAGSASPIPGLGRGVQIEAVRLAGVRGRIEAREGNVPLVVRAAHGFGQIVFLGADLDQGPVARWRDRPLLVARLLDLPSEPLDSGQDTTAVMHYGYTDLAGQLRSALDRFPGVSMIPFYGVVCLILIYFLLIGPGDYFFLRKLLRRTQLTWVSFPLVVVAATAGAYALAHHAKGRQLRLSQANLLDFDLAEGQVRGTTWANLFSPRMDRYDIAFRPAVPGGSPLGQPRTMVSWLGLPGRALGGMAPNTAQPAVWRDPYEILADGSAIRRLPVPVWSTKSLTVRWSATTTIPLQADLRAEDQLPVGTISHRFPFPLTDCLLAFDRWAYPLETVQPGQPVYVGTTSKRRSLRALLTGQKLVFAEADKARQRATPYKQASVDVRYILRAMMFHDAAGGPRYTELHNQYQQFADLSHLLKTDRAILVACPGGDSPEAGQFLRDGKPLANTQDRQVTVFRFVLPVAPAEE